MESPDHIAVSLKAQANLGTDASGHSRHAASNPAGTRVLIHNAPFLFTCDEFEKISIKIRHSVAIEGNTITDVLPADQVNPNNFDRVYDAGKRGGVVLTPGLINTHTHPPMYLLRSAMMLDEGEGIDETIASMPQWERAMEPDQYTIAAIGDITEEQKHGITTTLSHYGVFEPMEEAARSTGHNIINALSAASNSHPENTPELIERLIERRDTLTSTVAASLHYLYKASPDVLDKIAAMVREHDILFTCHTAESEMVARECEKRHRAREIPTLKKHGLLNKNTIISHAIYVSDADIKDIAEHQVGIAHLPTSNVIHKSGTFPYWKFDEAGAFRNITLGTDSVVSKSRLDLLTEAYQTRITHLYHRTVKFSSLFKMMTVNGGRILHEPERGRIIKGAKADIAFWKLKDRGSIPYDEDNPVTLLGNIITHGGRYVRDLMINGRFIIKDRRHQFIDESKLLSETQRAHMAMRTHVRSQNS